MKNLFLLLCLSQINITFASKTPQFEWAKQMGGKMGDYMYSLSTDANGNIYLAGYFSDTCDLDPDTNTLYKTSAGEDDIFISKLDANGKLLWSRQFGSTGSDNALFMTTDDLGNTYTTGYFSGTVDFDPGPGMVQLSSNGGKDIFVLKLDQSGNLKWVKKLGGYGNDEAYSISIDKTGNIYCGGKFYGEVDFDPGTGISKISGSSSIALFALKLDKNGNYCWAKMLADSDGNVWSLNVDEHFNLYTTGYFSGYCDFDPDTGIFKMHSYSSEGAFISSFDSTGKFRWAKGILDSNWSSYRKFNAGFSVTTDDKGYIYSIGAYEGGARIDTDTGNMYLPGSSSRNIYIAKYDQSGKFIWVKNVLGTQGGYPQCMILDKWGNLNISGSFNGKTDFDPGPDTFYLQSEREDIFVMQMDTSGNFKWASSSGGKFFDYSHSIDVDANGNIYCGGSFMDTSYFDPVQKRKEYISSGEYDMFLVKFSQCLTKDMTIISLPNALKVVQAEAQYQWLDCDENMNAINGETSREFKPKKNGNFAVAVTYGNCKDTSLCVNFSSNGIHAHNASQDIVFVYPNPFNDVLSIVVQQDVQLEVYNNLGSLVFAQTIPAGSCNIDLGNNAKGVYLLKIFNGKHTLIEKLIKI